ncbi:hypothetical protein B0H14DRAFT_2635399 [Mycena olivaceomarginata]|nr:hypothetical protein B0H14DRAFT_2635399 [Mycena olivaceomarginata]
MPKLVTHVDKLEFPWTDCGLNDNHNGGCSNGSDDKDVQRRCREAKVGKRKAAAPTEEEEDESTEAVADRKKMLARLEELGQQTVQILQEQEQIRRFLGVGSVDEDEDGSEEVGCKADKTCVQYRQEGGSCIIRGQGKAVACDECARRKRCCSFVPTKEPEGIRAAGRSGTHHRGGGGGRGEWEESPVDPKLIAESRNRREGQGLAIGGLQTGLARFSCTLDVQEERLGVITTALWEFFQDFLVEVTREAFTERANHHMPALVAQTSRQSQQEPRRRERTEPERRRVYRRRSAVDSEEEPRAEEEMSVDKDVEDPEDGAGAE